MNTKILDDAISDIQTAEEMLIDDTIKELELMKQNKDYVCMAQLKTLEDHYKQYRTINKIIEKRLKGERK